MYVSNVVSKSLGSVRLTLVGEDRQTLAEETIAAVNDTFTSTKWVGLDRLSADKLADDGLESFTSKYHDHYIIRITEAYNTGGGD